MNGNHCTVKFILIKFIFENIQCHTVILDQVNLHFYPSLIFNDQLQRQTITKLDE